MKINVGQVSFDVWKWLENPNTVIVHPNYVAYILSRELVTENGKCGELQFYLPSVSYRNNVVSVDYMNNEDTIKVTKDFKSNLPDEVVNALNNVASRVYE